MSRQIRDLEDELGMRFSTTAQRPCGSQRREKYFIEAQAVLRRAEEAVQMAKAVASGQRGEIHVGYAPSLTVELLPSALRFFQEANPGVRVQLHDMSTQEMLRGLRNEKLHIALMIQASTKVLDGLVFQELRRYAVCVAVHPSHPLARARKVGLEQIAAERLITYTLADYPEYHAWLSNLFAPLKRPPQIAEEHDGSTSLIASVEAGRGVALVQQGFECLAGPRLRIRSLTPAPPPFVVGIAFRKETNSAATENFIAAVKRTKTA